jgi:hypothetical protein
MMRLRCAVLLSFLAPGIIPAAEVKTFRAQSASAFLGGTLEGIGVDPLGALQLSGRAERLVALQEPFLLSLARHPDGWVVGTGNAGRVLKVDRAGQVTTLFAAPEPEIFALWVDPDGTVYAASSPAGKVYRIPPGGKGEAFFAPGETYIWALQRAADGTLLVATGTQGKLFAVRGRDDGKVIYDSDDTHLRALAARPSGDVLIGTAGEGLVLLLDAAGRARTLYDAEQPEVVGFATAPDGTSYTAVLASEAVIVSEAEAARPLRAPGEEPKEREPDESDPLRPVITVTEEGGAPQPAAPKPGPKGPRSEVLRIAPTGVVESVWTFADETVYALLWHADRLWVGTGLEGELYSLLESRMVLEKDVDERQIVALVGDAQGPSFATTNAAALYRMTGGAERAGTYTSQALDAGQVARFGVFRWRGQNPDGGRVTFSFRSGVSAEPDRTWSAWTPAAAGSELGLDVPPGRYFQWRAHLQADGDGSPRITGVEVSYRQENLRPKIVRFAALDPGEILVPANFNPANQVFEPAHPSRDGIFTTLEPAAEDGDLRLKTLWKKGFRTLRWEVEDANDDKLVYSLAFRPENGAEWLPMAEDLDEDHYAFDETALPDGVYRFRLTVTDREGNPPGAALTAEQVSESVVVDATPPELTGIDRQGGVFRVEVADALDPLREAVVSVDGEEWKPARVADGLLDGRRETFLVDRPAGAKLILLRLTDAAFNVVTFDLLRQNGS